MITYTCDGCGKHLSEHDLRYAVKIEVRAAYDELEIGLADLVRDQSLLERARDCAFDLVGSGQFDGPDYAPLKIRVLERFGTIMDLPQSG